MNIRTLIITALLLLLSHGSIANSEGKILFEKYCVLCHGVEGKGDGKLALHINNPAPANLTTTLLNDDELAQIIRDGGEAVGRSPSMPVWKDELNQKQTNEIINYIKQLKSKP